LKQTKEVGSKKKAFIGTSNVIYFKLSTFQTYFNPWKKLFRYVH